MTIRNYSLEQQFRVTDENANNIKNIKVMVCATEHGVENSNMEELFKDMAEGFVDYLHSQKKEEPDKTWEELENLFSDLSENDSKRKGKRGWFK